MRDRPPAKSKFEARPFILAALLGALALTSLYSYLLFHSLVEIISVVVACTIFIVAWSACRSLQNGYLLCLGITFLFIALFDTVHTLAYKGMAVFPGYDTNLPTQLWIASRYLLGAAFLTAPFYLTRKVSFRVGLVVTGVVTGLLMASIFLGFFPDCYIEGSGLTPFKIYSEYIIAVMLIAGLAALQRNRPAFDPGVLRSLEASLVLNILAGIAFTSYASVFGFANLLGHLLKTAAFYFLFHAIVETGFHRPFTLLLRELKQSEASLLQAQSELEKRVEERTRQLAQANRDLVAEISERLNAEKALRQSEARFRSIFENSSLGIIVVGMDGVIQSANHAMEEILEIPSQEIEGQHVADLTYREDVPVTRDLLQRLNSGSLHSFEMDKRYNNKRGEPVWVHLSTTKVLDEDGSSRFMVTIIQDIREGRRITGELREIQRRLMNSKEEERLRLARDLHDGPVQELLAAGFRLAQMIQDFPPEEKEKLRELYNDIGSVNQSLRVITAELRPQALAPFGLEKAIRSHANLLQHSHPDLDIQLDLQPDGQEFPETTRLALYRIYRQSMDNIIQHSSASQASVHFHFDGDQLLLEIADNGSGFQPPSSWIPLVRGNHFGLAGMSERVEALGGRLEIQSAPGQGTRIIARAPLTGERISEPASLQVERK